MPPADSRAMDGGRCLGARKGHLRQPAPSKWHRAESTTHIHGIKLSKENKERAQTRLKPLMKMEELLQKETKNTRVGKWVSKMIHTPMRAVRG